MSERLASLAVAALLAVLPLRAHAQAEDARALFLRGQTAYQQGDYDVAIEQWTRAYELDSRPLIQFNLAQAYERSGRLAEAAAAFDRYLETADPDDPNQADARAKRANLRERLASTGILITGAPNGAAIQVDGTDWGLTPRPDRIALEPGSHEVLLRKEGFADYRSTVVVPGGQTLTLEVEMVAGGGGDGDGGDDGGSGGGIGPWPFITMGVGAALAGTAVALGVVAMGAANDAESSTSDTASSARTMAALADVFGIVGGLAIAGGIIWLIASATSDGGEHAEAPAIDVRAGIGPGGGAVIVEGRL